MKIAQVYQTEDGVIHKTELAAKKHVEKLSETDDLAFQRFCNSRSGEFLLKDNDLKDHGTWEIRGEDPNCDFGGHHHEPYLDTVSCTLEKAIRHAVKLDRFFTWGAGGSISKVKVKTI